MFDRLPKSHTIPFLNKADHIAELPAGPATVALPARIDVKGGAVVFVEGAQALEGLAGRAQGDVGADDINDVVGRLDLPNQVRPVVSQGAPAGEGPR